MPTHAEMRILPHTPEQMFDLVADVTAYPEFLPWCTATRIRTQGDDYFVADMVVGFKGFREKFTSHVDLVRPRRIDVTYKDGPFRYLNNHWVFEPSGHGACLIDFYVDFEFRSKILQKAIGKVFDEAVRRMVRAFEARAQVIYPGPG